MVISKSHWSYAYDTYLKTEYTDRYSKMELKEQPLKELYDVRTSKKGSERVFWGGNIGDLADYNGTLDYEDIQQQYMATFTHFTKDKAIAIDKISMDDQEVDVLSPLPKKLAVSVNRTRAKHMEVPFIDAFSTGRLLADGTALCNTIHPLVGTATLQSNKDGSNTALSPAAILANRLAMRKLVDEKGNRLSVVADTLMVYVDNADKAQEILSTRGKLDVATHNVNLLYGELKLIVIPHSELQYPWFLLDSTLASDNLRWYDRMAPDNMMDVEFNNLVTKWAVLVRYSYGSLGWEYIFGSNATS